MSADASITAAPERPLSEPALAAPQAAAIGQHADLRLLTLVRAAVHDMCTPLTGIRGLVDLLRAGAYGPLNDDQQSALTAVGRAELLLYRLVTDLVDLLSVDAPSRPPALVACDLGLVVQETLELCQPQASARGLELVLRNEASPIQVLADVQRVQQIVLNLVGNALRYTVSGSVTVRVQAEAAVLSISVADTGPGIPSNLLERIWEPHVRLSSSGDGMGLGLYIVRQLAELMGGTVGVQSVVGGGSVFTVWLPRVAALTASISSS